MKKVFAYWALALLIFYMAYHPTDVVNTFKAIGGVLQQMAAGFGDFVKKLVS